MQPIKQTINYKEFFSNELTKIFTDISTGLIVEYPVLEIGVDYFLFASLSNKDTLLYKALNSFINETSIESIYKVMYYRVIDNVVTVLKPGRDIPFSKIFRNMLGLSYNEMEKTNCSLITSDHVLLAILQHIPEYQKIFLNEGLSYDIYREESKKIHATINEINEINETPKNVLVQINGGSEADVSNIIGNILGQNNANTGKKNKAVDNYCTNLINEAQKGNIDPLVGRDREIEQIVNIFNRRKSNNVVIVGDSGVGKTHLIEGLALLIQTGTAPVSLRKYTIYRLNPYEMMSGTNLRGMFEDRFNNLIKELKKSKYSVLFIDDFHNLSGDKKKEEYDFTGHLSEILTDGTIKVIISTTQKGYKAIFDNNVNLTRQFQKIMLEQPSIEESIKIIKNAKTPYENFHHIKYDDEAIECCVKLSSRYIPERALPASAFDIIDEAGSRKKIEIYEPKNLAEKLANLNDLEKTKEELVKKDEIDKAQEIENEINATKVELSKYCDYMEQNENLCYVNNEDIYKAISIRTNIPVSKINASERKTLANIDQVLKNVIIGQDEAIDLVTKAIKRNKVGLSPANRPIFSCLCIGNTGCGKTLLAKMLAKEIFGSEKNLLRFDMSEYADKTSVNKLIGSSAGYVGYDKGGLLTEAVRNKKHAVLLIDEIEKANDEVYNLFLQILDEGFLTDNSGNKIDFKNTIIILTSNVGVKKASLEKGLGFDIDENVNRKDIIEKELKNKFPPEFINRLDETIYFNNLTNDNLKTIIRLEINKLNERLIENNFQVIYSDEVIDYIFDIIVKQKEFGARPIIRAIQTEIENRITDMIIENGFTEHVFAVTCNNGELTIL